MDAVAAVRQELMQREREEREREERKAQEHASATKVQAFARRRRSQQTADRLSRERDEERVKNQMFSHKGEGESHSSVLQSVKAQAVKAVNHYKAECAKVCCNFPTVTYS